MNTVSTTVPQYNILIISMSPELSFVGKNSEITRTLEPLLFCRPFKHIWIA